MSYPPDGPGLPAPPSPPHPFGLPYSLPPRPRKFQSRLWLHAALLLATLATTTLTGANNYYWFASEFHRRTIEVQWLPFILNGFWYSLTLLAILGAHEMGHYVYCRRYDVDATLPFFLPMPFLLTGTLGAVIKIREPFQTRRALFDIGVAGPIAGFVVLVPALFFGLILSTVVPSPTEGNLVYLGEPLLFRWAMQVVFGTIQDGYTINVHPMAFAAWFGLLATAINLLPFGQLDGGHLTYAALGRWSTPISIATVSAAVVMTFVSISWLFMTVVMVMMVVIFGPHHPRVLYEDEPLGAGRILIAVLAFIILILCFTAVPIEFKDLIQT